MSTITLHDIGKCYGKNWVLKNISLTFEGGRIYGIIGRNGSGKTMLLKVISGLVSPSEGMVIVNGKQLGRDIEIPESIGAIIETPGFLGDMSGLSNLEYLASIRRLITREDIIHTMEYVGLSPNDNKKVRKYSLGMRQRLGIAQALMENPDILLLDEPMNGLDNQGVEDVREILMELRNKGKIIILASHHMEDIELLCDDVYLMEAGCVRQAKM